MVIDLYKNRNGVHQMNAISVYIPQHTTSSVVTDPHYSSDALDVQS
jgi:hypothetical protein